MLRCLLHVNSVVFLLFVFICVLFGVICGCVAVVVYGYIVVCLVSLFGCDAVAWFVIMVCVGGCFILLSLDCGYFRFGY